MTQIATVIKVLDDETALVSVERRTACGHDCSSCGANCSQAFNNNVVVQVKNTAGADAGDKVELYSPTRKVLGAAVLVYLVPVLLFIAAVFVTTALKLGDGYSALISVGLFLAGVAIAVIYNKRIAGKKTISYEIVKILE